MRAVLPGEASASYPLRHITLRWDARVRMGLRKTSNLVYEGNKSPVTKCVWQLLVDTARIALEITGRSAITGSKRIKRRALSSSMWFKLAKPA